jgi:hypothetical protein
MKSLTRRLVRFLLGACALPLFATAQTTPAVPAVPQTPQTPAGPAGSTTSPGTPATIARFSDLTKAAPAVAGPAQTVTSLADSIRLGILTLPSTATGANPLTSAVAQANTAIIRDGQAVRAEALSGRQRTLTRLRLAQTEAERQKLIADLRLQSGERLDDQRETARLVRDRLRQVRDDATLTRPAPTTP